MRSLLTLLLSIISLASYCYDIEVDGIYYNEISFLGRKVAVTASPDGNKYSGDIVIPSEIVVEGMTFSVVEIEPDAFKDCTNLYSLVVGSNVESIGARAFKTCSNLKELTIGPKVEIIGLDSFTGCTSLTILSFEDNESILFINPKDCEDTAGPGRGAFYDCPLDSIYFGRELDYEKGLNGASAPFYGNHSIRSVKFGNRVNIIKEGLVGYCNNIKNVDFGNHVKIIGGGAFDNIGAEEIVLPESIDSIGANAFSSCDNLKNVISLRKDPQPIHVHAFEYPGWDNQIQHMTLFYPVGCRTKYRQTEGWNKFRKYQEITPSQLIIDKKDTTIYVGDTVRTIVNVLPYYAELTTVEWASSNEDVAIVDSTGLITFAEMKNVSIVSKKFKNLEVTAIVTAGVRTNASRAGDEASYWEDNGEFHFGTINVILLTNARLGKPTLTEAFMTVTEAKSVALNKLKIPSQYSNGFATGTGTDGVAIFSNLESDNTLNNAGKHSKLGELIGKSVIEAITKAIGKQVWITNKSQSNALVRLNRYSLDINEFYDKLNCDKLEFINQLRIDAKKQDNVAITTSILNLIDEVDDNLIQKQDAYDLAIKIKENCNSYPIKTLLEYWINYFIG